MKIQDMVACPKCGYERATHEQETVDGSEKLVCQRCAYIKRVIPEIDWEKSRLTEQQARELAKAGRYAEASELMGCDQEHEGAARTEVKRRLSNGLIMLKRNQFGQFIYRIEESGGYGSYLVRDPDNGQVEVGQMPADETERARLKKRLKNLEEFGRVVRIFEWEPERIMEEDGENMMITARLAGTETNQSPVPEAI